MSIRSAVADGLAELFNVDLIFPEQGAGTRVERLEPAVSTSVKDEASSGHHRDGLIGLVQMNALEYHVWETTVANLERVDRLVLDLDPAPGLSWDLVIQGALALHARLTALHLQCFVRTSAGKGLHVVVPTRPATDWETARGFARALAEGVARDNPQRFLATASKAEHRGRIFIDYLRNARGSTAICSYSLRNRPGAPIATPLSWEELPRIPAPDHFRFGNIRRRLARLATDPWEGIDRLKQALPDPEG